MVIGFHHKIVKFLPLGAWRTSAAQPTDCVHLACDVLATRRVPADSVSPGTLDGMLQAKRALAASSAISEVVALEGFRIHLWQSLTWLLQLWPWD